MLRKIKYGILAFLLILLIAGVLKDRAIDAPRLIRQHLLDSMTPLAAQTPVAGVIETSRLLTYKMYLWSLVPAGTMRLKTQYDGRLTSFSLKAVTDGGWVRFFLEAMVEESSVFDPQTMSSLAFIENMLVKEKKKTKRIDFDHEQLIASRNGVKIRIPKNTYDPVSAFMVMLTQPFFKGSKSRLRLITKEEIYVFSAECLNTDNGLYELRMEMRREDRSSAHGISFRLWVTADNARIPVLFKCFSGIGYITLVLEQVEAAESR